MSTVFPFRENARDCTDKGGACRAGSAWLNYYIKSIRRLGRGPDIAADLGEKSGMIGSCERDACGSARPKVETVRPFAAYRPDRAESRTARQGISSTDKDVTEDSPGGVMAGGFSSLPGSVGNAISGLAISPMSDHRSLAYAFALVDGRYGRGLDSGTVSVKLPMGKQDMPAAFEGGSGLRISGEVPEQMVRRPIRAVSRRRSSDRLPHLGGPSPCPASRRGWRERIRRQSVAGPNRE